MEHSGADVRDVIDTDVETLVAVADAPVRAVRRLIHDRTVRLVTAETSSDLHADAPAGNESVFDFVGFDVRDDVLHVTRLGGTEVVVWRLFEEPLRFANAKDPPVEVLVLESEALLCEVAKYVDFDHVSHGPRFEGLPAFRYILDETG